MKELPSPYVLTIGQNTCINRSVYLYRSDQHPDRREPLAMVSASRDFPDHEWKTSSWIDDKRGSFEEVRAFVEALNGVLETFDSHAWAPGLQMTEVPENEEAVVGDVIFRDRNALPYVVKRITATQIIAFTLADLAEADPIRFKKERAGYAWKPKGTVIGGNLRHRLFRLKNPNDPNQF